MLAWDPALETGIASIDQQHRILFRRAGATLEAVAAGGGAAQVKETIQFLADYAALHFEAEERMMRAAAYPEATAHAEIHRRMERRLMEIGAEFHEKGVTAALVADVEALMRGWVTQHIGEKDRAFADFVAAVKRPA